MRPILVALVVTGCAQTMPVVKEGNSETVIIDWFRSTQGSDGSLAIADQHCSKFGKKARYSGKPNTFQLAYDCVQ